MAILAFQRSEEYDSIECGDCGIVFYVSADLKRKWVEKRGSFYCPNGHSRKFIGETEADRIKRELQAQIDAATRDAEWWRVRNAEKDRKLSAAKGQMTKLKKRVGNGVCPCCQRTFKQLAAHMAHKHPDYKAVPVDANLEP